MSECKTPAVGDGGGIDDDAKNGLVPADKSTGVSDTAQATAAAERASADAAERARIRGVLDTQGGNQPVASYENTEIIYDQDPDLQRVGRSIMGGILRWRSLPSWRKPHELHHEVDDRDVVEMNRVTRWYFGGRHNSLAIAACDEARIRAAGGRPFSPWADFLDHLPDWDGVPRMAEAIPGECLEGGATDYSRAALGNFFLGLVSRAFDPGCQHDLVLVLVGPQGTRKTSWFRAITPSRVLPVYEASTVPDAGKQTDAMMAAHRSPIVLLDEMDKLRTKDDQSALKALISGRVDMWRAPYGKVVETHRRSFVIAGTTNESEFLLDLTGNRRYMPLVVEAPIPDKFLAPAWMMQGLAEARDRYKAGERVDASAVFDDLAEDARAQHVQDPTGDAVRDFLETESPDRVSVKMLMQLMPEYRAVSAASATGRVEARRIEQALDSHPDYERNAGTQRVRHGFYDFGRTRKSWDRVGSGPAQPTQPVQYSPPEGTGPSISFDL